MSNPSIADPGVSEYFYVKGLCLIRVSFIAVMVNVPSQSIIYILFLAHDVNIIIILKLLPMMFPFRPHSEVISGFLPRPQASPAFFFFFK